MTNLGFYILTWTVFCSCTALPDIHRQMSSQELQSVFHVDDADLVPNYEIIKLVHHSTSHRTKRSINNNLDINLNSNSNNLINNKYNKLNLKTNNNNKEPHHVKKDLSKVSYFSDAKTSYSSDKLYNNSNKNLSVSDIKEHSVSFDAFGKTLNLTLKPTEGLFKNGPASLRMFSVHSDPNSTQGLDYQEILEENNENSDEHIGEIFQDQENMAAILMRRHLETGDLIMEGSIGQELVIKPMPTEILPNSEDGRVHHVIYKREITEDMDQLSDFAYMEPDRLQKRYRQQRSVSELFGQKNVTNSRSKRAVPHIIYPEILVIVDYDGYRLHGGDNVQVKRYFVSFWNGVDLRYRLLKGPRIRISIAGIIISRGRDATPYLERNRVGRDAIDSAAALTDMGKYLFRERRLPVYDIAVAITKLDMCRRQYANDACNRGTAGFAYVGGACVVNKRLEKVNSVAIIEDTGGFSGIIVAAHEVGHLLGAVHDGSPPPSYLGGPGAEKCRWEDGYIMSDLRHTERGFRWSPCSVQSFHHFLNGDTASCLHNAPHEEEALGRALPGTLLSLDAQCRRDRGTSACFKDERVCAQLFCFDSASGYCVAYRPAAEGSTCGDGSHCLDGRCVAEHENIIPDYSQHTPSYASPNSFNQPNTDKYVYNDDTATPKSTTQKRTTTTTQRTTTTTTTPVPTTSRASSYYYNNPTRTTRNYFNNGFFNSYSKTTQKPTTDSTYYYYDSSTTPPTEIPTTATTTKAPFSTTTSKWKFNFFDSFFNRTTTTRRTTTTTRPTTTTTKSTDTSYYYNNENQEIQNNNYQNNNYHTNNEQTYDYYTTTTPRTTTKATTTKVPFFTSYFNRPSTTTIKYTYFPTYSYSYTSTTTTPRPPLSTSSSTLYIPSTTSTPSSTTQSTTSTKFTRHPVFDVYFKRSTTKSPYDFENFFQYFKTSSPKYSYNYFGSNSNSSPVNRTSTN